MKLFAEKYGEPKTRQEFSGSSCAACEFARSALRNEGDVIFVVVTGVRVELRRVEFRVDVGQESYLICKEVTEDECKAAIEAEDRRT